MHNLDLTLSDITKIEGKASCEIKIRNGKVEVCNFSIAEYKRFYTQAIRGKDVLALPQLTCRICGTCSNAHLLCAIKAVENALGIVPPPQTKLLRRLVNFGLIIRDHALHLCVFVLPDILGVDNILELDENDKKEHQILDDVFTIKAIGNLLGKTIGGRSVHAPYPTIGGFIKLPDPQVFPELISQLESARPAVRRMIDIFENCDFYLEQNGEFGALIDKNYSFLEGEIFTSGAKVIPEVDFGNYLEHIIIPYSHASGYKFAGRVQMVGALARMNLAKEKLHPRTRVDAASALSFFPSHNIYHNNLAQAIEILHAIDSAIDILTNLKIIEEKPVPIVRKEGRGVGVIEAPRGTLYYRLEIEATGRISKGQIVVPTGVNQIGIEGSIRKYLEDNIGDIADKEAVEHEIEKIVRAFDPCMSCASHFLKVKWI